MDVSFLNRCIDTLEKAYGKLKETNKEEIDYDLYRSACIKEFEIILEQSGKLLKKALVPYFHSAKAVQSLYFKDVFRQATNKGFLDLESCERWMQYRDNRNQTSHDYGEAFAEQTLVLFPQFIKDARSLSETIQEKTDDSTK